MIVCYNEKGWQVTTQRSHGLLAGQICARWKLDNQPEQWVETLIATTEHDDVFNEFERNPLIDDKGAPINFKMTGFDLEAATRLMDMALTKSRFITLLISRHIEFTHGDDVKAKNFLAGLKKSESKWIKEAGTTKAELSQAYELLEFCDAFSLLICQEQIPPEQRRLEISNGPDGKSYTLFQSGESLIVEPWPFAVETFEVSYERREINELKFDNDESFRDALKNAPVKPIRIRISKV
ncbi:DUF3891 family protein [Pedobacter petrophilus]|uniref:DUF3891 family protein n=1 Tax=Pedobacter petrophilus TaxID=1908241 RepID=A0A7K0FYK2_9SPHI|nr:DUF3891 family protein [Pedobacter petrophilus]MRX76462.1 DUF3891 family protein [Pedobacter petrophilus]